MARSLGQLTLDMILRTGSFTDPLNKTTAAARKGFNQINDDAVTMSKIVGGAIKAIGATAIFTRFITQTRNAQNEQAQLTAVLRSTGEAAGFSQTQLNGMADNLKGIFSSGEINQAQTALLAFTNIAGTQFVGALQSAIDMSARTGQSLQSTAETIGRALDVPSAGYAALSRQGFRFTEEQKKLIVQLENAGRTAEAQGIILDALKESYGGAADAARDTFGGALLGLRNTIDDILTGQSGINAATAAINKLSDALSSPEAATAINILKDAGIVLATVYGGRVAGGAITSFISLLVLKRKQLREVAAESLRYQTQLAALAGVTDKAVISQQALNATIGTTSKNILRSAVGVFGGPAGLISTVAIAATTMYAFRDSSSDATQTLQDMSAPLDDIVRKFKELSTDQRASALIKYTEAAEQGAQDAKIAFQDLIRSFGSWSFTGLNNQQRSSLVQELATAKSEGEALTPILQRVGEAAGVKQSKIDEWIKLAGAYDTANAQARSAKNVIDELNEIVNAPAKPPENITKPLRDPEIVKAIEKQVKALEDQADALGLSAYMAQLHKLEMEGATKAELDRAEAALSAIKEYNLAEDQRKKALESANAVMMIQADQLRKNQAIANEFYLLNKRMNLEISAVGMGDRRAREAEAQFAIEQEYHQKRVALMEQMSELELNQRREQTRLSEEVYTAQQGHLAAQLEQLKEHEAQRLAIATETNERILEEQGNWVNGMSRAFENYTDQARDIAGKTEQFFTNAFSHMEDATYQFVTTGKLSLSDLFTSIAKDAVRMLTSYVTQLLITTAMEKMIKTTAASGYVTQISGQAGAALNLAALNAFAATAAIPITGPAAAPAAAAAAVTAASPFAIAAIAGATSSLAGMAHSGIDYIPKEGTWLLDKGERVLSPRQNADLTQYLSSASGSAAPVSIQVAVNVESGEVSASPTTTESSQYRMLGEMIASKAREVIIQEQRPYGLLDPSLRAN